MESEPAPPSPSPQPEQQPSTPPALPPPLPEATTPPPLPVISRPPQRLHPSTFIVNLWGTVSGLLLPAILLFVVNPRSSMGYFFIGLLVLNLVSTLIRYFTFTYAIENGELITREGFFSRKERNIPLSRVQDVRIQQGILHRFLKVADVQVETAGGSQAEASLSVLALDEAERLRTELRSSIQQKAAAAATAHDPTAPLSVEVIRQLSVKELIVSGLTSNHIASTLAIVAGILALLDDVIGEVAYERYLNRAVSIVEQAFASGGHPDWLSIVMIVAAVVLGSALFSAIGAVILFYGFTLSRQGEDLQRRYGLFTQRSSNLTRRRIQLIKIEESVLRRAFGLATIYADTAGAIVQQPNQQQNGHNVLLPVISRPEADALLPQLLPSFHESPEPWRQVSRRAIRRGTMKGTIVCLLLTLVLSLLTPEWTSLWPLLFLPVIYAINVLNYRHLGYQTGDEHFRTRRGWLGRSTHVVPLRNIQAVVVHQTIFDRRHKVATVIIDTAGQAYTGGGPRISNVPFEEAQTLAAELSRQAAKLRYRW